MRRAPPLGLGVRLTSRCGWDNAGTPVSMWVTAGVVSPTYSAVATAPSSVVAAALASFTVKPFDRFNNVVSKDSLWRAAHGSPRLANAVTVACYYTEQRGPKLLQTHCNSSSIASESSAQSYQVKFAATTAGTYKVGATVNGPSPPFAFFLLRTSSTTCHAHRV